MKSLQTLPEDEQKHFMKCPCGEYFDMRDLSEVMKHFHAGEELPQQAEYTHSIKVGEPHLYTKTKKKITIN